MGGKKGLRDKTSQRFMQALLGLQTHSQPPPILQTPEAKAAKDLYSSVRRGKQLPAAGGPGPVASRRRPARSLSCALCKAWECPPPVAA